MSMRDINILPVEHIKGTAKGFSGTYGKLVNQTGGMMNFSGTLNAATETKNISQFTRRISGLPAWA